MATACCMRLAACGYAPYMRKRRVTVTVDEDLVDEAAAAVAEGQAESVSAWVSEAMALRYARDRRLAELASLISAYETEHGVISDEELAEQAQADRDAAASVRSGVRRAG